MATIKAKAISAKKALSLYSEMRGGPYLATQLLAFHLREGNIRVRARHVWISKEPSLRRAWRNEPDKDDFKNRTFNEEADVKKDIWRRSIDWNRDVSLWDINRGRFVVTLSNEPDKRIMIRGLRFHSGDARKTLDVPKNHKARNAPNEWREFWHEIIRLARPEDGSLGQLESTEFNSDDKLAANFPSDFDRDLASSIEERTGYAISSNAILEEVSALRKALRLTRTPRKLGRASRGT